jgi:hypothetical protein
MPMDSPTVPKARLIQRISEKPASSVIVKTKVVKKTNITASVVILSLYL